MFKKFTNGCVNVVNRWLPDPFLFAIILSIVVYIAAMFATGMGPVAILDAWGNSKGFWNLLAFSMQMALVLVLGSAMASAPVFKRALKAVARRVPTVDYRLLIAAAYSGFVVWHAGLSGSIPLTLGQGYTIGETTYQAGTMLTIFHPMNLVMCLVILVAMPLVEYAMHPDEYHTICVDPALLVDPPETEYTVETPAEKIEHSRILWVIVLVAGFAYVVYYFYTVVVEGLNAEVQVNPFFSIVNNLNLNIVNFIFLFLGLLLHGDLRRYVDAITEAAGGAAGILLQFPFYAGIMGMMVVANEQGVSLAGVISQFFVSISNTITFPVFTFLSAGIVNFFVPSGGGQWAVQGPIVMPAAAQLGVEPGRAAMAIAWGDQWTNMIQPFWALPALGVAGLKAKDIMGYLVVVLIFTGIVACLGFLAWGFFFPG